MTKYQKGDRIRVTYPSGTVVEGEINWVRDDATVIDIREVADHLREGTPEFNSIELLERAAPPNGDIVRATTWDGQVRVGEMFEGRVYYQKKLIGDEKPVSYDLPLSDFEKWEVVA